VSAAADRFKSSIQSPLKGVPSHVWTLFVWAMDVQPMAAISDSGGLGSYDMRARRLVELGYASGLRSTRTKAGRQVRVCDFMLPWTQARFLADPMAQYTALAQSMRLYYDALHEGRLTPVKGASMAGMLGALHRGGRGALESWPTLFDNTRMLVEKVKDLF
jgi:hypothetical protein